MFYTGLIVEKSFRGNTILAYHVASVFVRRHARPRRRGLCRGRQRATTLRLVLVHGKSCRLEGVVGKITRRGIADARNLDTRHVDFGFGIWI